MLIIFKSKSSPEVLMFKEHAQRILDLLHKNHTRGIITAAEAGEALILLEKEVALSRVHQEHNLEHDIHTPPKEEDETAEQAEEQKVGFAARAYPLLEMLRAAKTDGEDIVWGI